MKIIGMMRVRNEARWILRVAQSILPVCERVVMLDDHSDDGTPEICEVLPGMEVHRSEFDGLNEARDKNHLLGLVAKHNPQYVLHIDGDEELEQSGPGKILESLGLPPAFDAYRLPVLYLWDSPDQIRVDGIYRSFGRSSLFRYVPGWSFRSTGNGGNFHCGNVPQQVRNVGPCNARLLHWGYIHRDDRIRKYHWYNAKDPNNRAEDSYRHMVIADLFPPESKFKHGGPIKLQPLSI